MTLRTPVSQIRRGYCNRIDASETGDKTAPTRSPPGVCFHVTIKSNEQNVQRSVRWCGPRRSVRTTRTTRLNRRGAISSHLFLPFTFDILHQLRIPNYVEGLFGHILIYSYREYCMYFMEVIDPCLSVLLFFSEFFLESVNDI